MSASPDNHQGGDQSDASLVTPPSLDQTRSPPAPPRIGYRIILICAVAVVVGALAGGIAQVLVWMINVITDIFFYGSISAVVGPHALPLDKLLSPASNHLGLGVIGIPVIGGLAAGVMARWGSRQIQGHGIPEAMESVLKNESDIPPRVTWLKPLSAAFTIGTGGPFGAEGPIISTGGAVGSLFGQLLKVTAQERKVLLAAGAAGGMAAIFGAPLAAIAMAVELLLFEFRPRSLIPVGFATVAATAVRYASFGSAPIFFMPHIAEPHTWALACYVVVGAIVGYAGVWVSKSVYFVEDSFGKLPHVHWMWWPALGAIATGVVGFFSPHTLGVGYDNIDAILQGHYGLVMLGSFGALKFISWAVSIGSGTSAGTLAPLFMMGGSLGGVIGYGFAAAFPALHIDPRIAALVGMGAMFTGSARALMTSVFFCYETTHQPAGLLPLIGGCTAAFLVSAIAMRSTLMTEKLERRGHHVPDEYVADDLSEMLVGETCTREVATLKTSDELADVRRWLDSGDPGAQHQGFPVLDDGGCVRGLAIRRNLSDPGRPAATRVGDMLERGPVVVFEDNSLRDAADLMVTEGVRQVMVVKRDDPRSLLGLLTQHDVLAANSHRIHAMHDTLRTIRWQHSFRWYFGSHQDRR